jgi:CheY-like chemotaxis protein
MILVVDTDTARMSVMRHLLESVGHTVVPAMGSKVAIDAIKTRPHFDAVIAYEQLGEPSGLDVLSFAKTHVKNKELKTLLLIQPRGDENVDDLLEIVSRIEVDLHFVWDDREKSLRWVGLLPEKTENVSRE